jgi:hypothetical protein
VAAAVVSGFTQDRTNNRTLSCKAIMELEAAPVVTGQSE